MELASFELREVFGLIGFELLDAGFAAKFDLLAVVNLGDGAAHAVEVVATDEAFGEGVGLGFLGGGSGFRGRAGGEGEAEEGGGEEGAECRFHFSGCVEVCVGFSECVRALKSG